MADLIIPLNRHSAWILAKLAATGAKKATSFAYNSLLGGMSCAAPAVGFIAGAYVKNKYELPPVGTSLSQHPMYSFILGAAPVIGVLNYGLARAEIFVRTTLRMKFEFPKNGAASRINIRLYGID